MRTARGTVLLANAAGDLGEAELKAAAQMAPDAARRNIMAMLHLTQGQGEVAAREISQALAESPDFALGQVTLAAVHLSAGEREQARAALEKAESLDPKLGAVLLTWSQFYASAGQNEQALTYARRAVEAQPKDPQGRLLLAGLYRQAARYDAMREEARKVIELTPGPSKDRMRELIGRLLGPTALEPAADEPSAPAAPAADAPAPAAPDSADDLQLRAPGSGDSSRLRLLDGQGQRQHRHHQLGKRLPSRSRDRRLLRLESRADEFLEGPVERGRPEGDPDEHRESRTCGNGAVARPGRRRRNRCKGDGRRCRHRSGTGRHRAGRLRDRPVHQAGRSCRPGALPRQRSRGQRHRLGLRHRRRTDQDVVT